VRDAQIERVPQRYAAFASNAGNADAAALTEANRLASECRCTERDCRADNANEKRQESMPADCSHVQFTS
jgi:hypothetical protein